MKAIRLNKILGACVLAFALCLALAAQARAASGASAAIPVTQVVASSDKAARNTTVHYMLTPEAGSPGSAVSFDISGSAKKTVTIDGFTESGVYYYTLKNSRNSQTYRVGVKVSWPDDKPVVTTVVAFNAAGKKSNITYQYDIKVPAKKMTPARAHRGKAAKTGDATDLKRYLEVTAAAALVLIVLACANRKKEEDEM